MIFRSMTFIFLTLLLKTSFSQPGFQKTYSIEDRGTAFHNMILKDDTLIVAGIHFSDEPVPRQGILFAKLDTFGNMLNYTFHLDSLGDDYALDNNYDFIPLSDGGYALVGVPFARKGGFLMKFDVNGNQVFVREYADSTVRNAGLRNVIEVEDGFLIAGVEQNLDYSNNIHIKRLNSSGDILWHKSYGAPLEIDVLGSLLKLDNQTFVIGAARGSQWDIPIEDRWFQSRIIIINGQGDILWSWASTLNVENGIVGLNPTQDGGWIYCSNNLEISEYNDFNRYPKIVKRDSQMNLEWEQVVDVELLTSNTYIDLKPNADTSAWIGIGNWAPELGTEIWGGSCIYKISPEGEKLWTRCDTVPWAEPTNSREYYGGMVVLPSGSIIAAGRSDKSFPNPKLSFGWLVKTDKNGCVDTLCHLNTAILEQQSAKTIKAFPNPADDRLTIDFGEQHYQVANVSGFHATGKQLFTQEIKQYRPTLQLDVSQVPPGMLFLRVIVDHQKGQTIKVMIY